MDHGKDCLFCDIGSRRVVFSGELVVGIWDDFPVSPGHILIVPRRHAEGFDDLTGPEKAAVWLSVNQAMAEIRERHSPEGFNVGFNQGAAAGQTIFHFHLHVIPRYAGDVSDPRGGVRHVIPDQANYLSGHPGSPEQRLVKGAEDPFLPHLVRQIDSATSCDMAVAFLLDSGARLIVEHLRDFLERGGKARILVSDYLDVTDPMALRRFADLSGDLTLRIYETEITGFHPKSYIFLDANEGVAFVGSSNLSQPALTTSIEWNYKVVSSHDVDGFREIQDGFEELFVSYAAVPVTPSWIEGYEQRRIEPLSLGLRPTPGGDDPGVPYEVPLSTPEPHSIQDRALAALDQTRNDGFTAGLVVLATGLGKTWLAAFDSDRLQFHRVLFVAHREEILSQAIETFRRIRPKARIGRLAGEQRETTSDLLFASVQTLGRFNHLSGFAPDHFDYIVIDEFHHAAAATYRRIIDHFSPKFLLGLTATPERTDGGDLLGLCQENLVFQAGIHEGIEGGHLCPFHYFGVPDEVDYANIPWRNAKFDLDELTAAVATENRAQNAVDHLLKLGGRRAIGFCCSQRHADFMAAFCSQKGIRAVAVHAGQGSAPRTSSLQRLQAGELDIVFAVDMFNEGVDVPTVDTVLMLRPTESTIIWLQQLGRGLRLAPQKDRLVVIDYIGNHRAFLMKLRSLAALTENEIGSPGRMRNYLEAVVENKISLPSGCAVTYDLAAIDMLRHLLRPTGTENALESFYQDFLERHGVRPTAAEVFHAGLSPRANGERSWLGFVERMSGLQDQEYRTFAAARDFFSNIEKTEATRSYKIVLLLAMLQGVSLAHSLHIEEITRRVTELARKIHRLADDFSADLEDPVSMERLLLQNPIKAFVDARGTGGVSYFHLDGKEFRFAFDIGDTVAFAGLLREILDWRLAQYLSRRGETSADIICRVARNNSGNPILFLPGAGGRERVPEGPVSVEVNGRLMEATVAKIAINVIREEGVTSNRLPEILNGWFGGDAGLPGRGDRVRLRHSDGGFVLEPLRPVIGQSDGLVPWERYLREAIPPAFSLEFSQAIWNAGFVLIPPHMFLLVTLDKDDMMSEHRYSDHFLSDQEFSWQSQNRTTKGSKHGLMIGEHRVRGIHVHLLVRPTKKTGSRPTPFTYCGEIDFVSWEGEAPITVRWRLRQPVPASLHSTLRVP